MKLSQFRFQLPEEQVALYPTHKAFTDEQGNVERIYRRDQCRMMVAHRKSGRIDLYKKDAKGKDTTEPIVFRDIVNYFDEGDTFVFNDTKVFPARLYGTKEKTDSKIEVFLLRELNDELRLWDVLVEPARKIRIGNKLFFEDDGPMVAEVIDNTTSRGRTLRFLYECPHDEFKQELYSLGHTPLPKYIIDRREVDPEDEEMFQTIYAANEGAVTAPATGLHFSRELLKLMEIREINKAYVTLHCGLSAFENIEVEDLSKHKMSSERMLVTAEACKIVNATKLSGHRLCAVGASVARATETAVGTDGLLKEYEGWTNKFMFPPYEFGLCTSMVVNFYHPESPMMMSTASFGGYDLVWECYQRALKEGFQFGCFGDALLLLDD